MLPSCGHFKNIPCPFYKLALCVRPHCPYKHQNSDGAHQRQLFTPLVDETESLYDSKVNLNAILQKSAYHDTATESQENATYIPTPVDSGSKPPGILKTGSNLERPSTSYVPEYKPTPISKLKEFTTVPVKASKSEYTPEFPVTVRKKKNVEEYDPTEVKCIPKKSVTFVDQTDNVTDVPVILISSDEDLDDNESAPKFSDDDFEEEAPSISDSTKQVPDVITIKEEEVDEEVKIDEFSVVDKILVDCKKNEMLLNSFKKIPPKTNDLSSKILKHDKSISLQKSDIKSSKTHSTNSNKVEKNISSTNSNKTEKNTLSVNSIKVEKNISSANSNKVEKNVPCTNKTEKNVPNISSIKLEKNVSSSKTDDNSSHKSKSKKDEISDSVTNTSKVKKCDNLKKESKSEKGEASSDKAKKSSSHSSHNKEKLKKDSKDIEKSKLVKKIPHETKKLSSNDNKHSKSDRHSSSESSDKKESKKLLENHSVKQIDGSNGPNKKKSKYENINNLKSSEPLIIRSKEKSSSQHSSKRKSDIISDSDSEHHSSKFKSSWEVKKVKICDDVSSSTKPSDSSAVNDGNHSDSDVDETLLNDILSSSDSEDPFEECRRIFNECYPEDSQTSKEEKKKEEVQQQPKSSKTSDLVILRKKRYAHPAAAELKPPAKQTKVEMKRPLNPAQVMHNRFAQCKARFAQLNDNKDFGKTSDKRRISFAPNQNLLAAVKNKNQGNTGLGNFSPLPPTVSKTLKVTKRTAHIPEAAMKPRPIIPADYGCKVPHSIRQRYLNAFIDECLKFCLSEDEAYDLALEEEKKVYDRSSSKSLYLNVAANALKRLRRRAEEGPEDAGNSSVSSKSNSAKSEQRMVSHETVLNGPIAQRRSFSIGKKKEAPEIKAGTELYEYLLTYVMTPEQLKENSYPRPHPTEVDKAVIEGAYANKALYCNDAFKRMCSRCHKTYYVNVEGDYVRDEECDFHWGRLWKKRIAGSFESRYSCCQGDAESDGCCVSPGHVFDGSEAHVLKGYVRTLPKTPPPDNYYGIYALDCEMCYTSAGMELTRVTVVDTDLKPVFESFVKPRNKVLDYNTRFSGITEDDLKNVKTTLTDVQAVLLCIFNDKTILIGHSLESDFKALKLFHNTVIDTSVVFPHKSGLPYKRALKTLMAEKLNKIIQNDVGGHDSQEDAVACMELMLWKVKEDARGNR